VSPGFIDAHIHVEYTKLTPGELARLSIPRRTTTVLADANCIGNIFGREWISWVRSIQHAEHLNTRKEPLRRRSEYFVKSLTKFPEMLAACTPL
jgi:adenine deaminase